MGGSRRVRRNGWASAGFVAVLLGLAVAGCAEHLPAPLPSTNGRALVLGPEPDFNPAALPADWFLAPTDAAGAFKVVDLSGTPVLRVEGSRGALLGRHIATPLLATPYIHAGLYLDPALYGGGPLDGLPRGLRLIVGFKGGMPGGSQLIDRLFTGDLPPYHRFIEIRLGGVGAARSEDALLELAAVSDRGMRRTLRGPDRGETGKWHIEAIDLAALYRSYWPRDRIGQVEIAFVAVGGLRHHPVQVRSGNTTPAPAGYIAEILLTR